MNLTGGNKKFRHRIASNQYFLIKNLELLYEDNEVESLIIQNMIDLSINQPYLDKYMYYFNKISFNQELSSKFLDYIQNFKNYVLNKNIVIKKFEQVKFITKFKNENKNNLESILFITEILIEINVFKDNYINLNVFNYFLNNECINHQKYEKLNKLRDKYKNIQFCPNLYIFIKHNLDSNIKYLSKLLNNKQ